MSELNLIRQMLAERLSPPQALPIEAARIAQAAVTIILRETQSTAELLIIKRAEHPHDPWSGHLALPGGRADATDAHLLATAARETLEEIGLDLHTGGAFIGVLPVFAPHNPRLPQLEIAPFVALAPPTFALTLSDEVADVFWVPVGPLKRNGHTDHYAMRFGEIVRKWPAYPSAGGPIWGITERILTSFLALLD